MNNAANLLDNIEETMSNASAEDIAKLAQQVQNDPAIKTLIARAGVTVQHHYDDWLASARATHARLRRGRGLASRFKAGICAVGSWHGSSLLNSQL